jgi:hypothetical protein
MSRGNLNVFKTGAVKRAVRNALKGEWNQDRLQRATVVQAAFTDTRKITIRFNHEIGK